MLHVARPLSISLSLWFGSRDKSPTTRTPIKLHASDHESTPSHRFTITITPPMEVTVSDTTLIYASKPPFTHDHTLSLSHLDTDSNLNVTFRYLRAYVSTTATNHPNSDPVHVISTALSHALVPYYPFSGTLRPRSVDHRLELHCAVGKGVPLIYATSNVTLDSVNYLDDPDTPFVEQLVPDPDPEERLIKPFSLQVTVFGCGGYTLGASIYHSLCDGLGATQFFNVMAEFARGATQLKFEPVWDRAKLLGPRDPPRAEVPFHEFLCMDKGSEPYTQMNGLVIKECFHVRDVCLDRFKNELLEQSGMSFTTFEALGAYIWRAKVKSSGVPGHEKVKLAYSINIRKLVKPPLPVGYWGNGCVPMYVQLSAIELMEKPIWETAELIKKIKSNAGDEYVRSFIDFQELNYGKGITAGNQVSGFTDWRHLGHSTVDFGWGGPVTVLPLSRNILGSVEPCFFLPYSSANAGNKDGFKVLVSLRDSAMPAFRQEMEKFTSQARSCFNNSIKGCL